MGKTGIIPFPKKQKLSIQLKRAQVQRNHVSQRIVIPSLQLKKSLNEIKF
jgi:hypothetical protein